MRGSGFWILGYDFPFLKMSSGIQMPVQGHPSIDPTDTAVYSPTAKMGLVLPRKFVAKHGPNQSTGCSCRSGLMNYVSSRPEGFWP